MERMKIVAAQAATLAALVIAWDLALRFGWADPLFVPAPAAVAAVLGATAGEAWARLGDTLLKAAAAYAIAVALGVAGGLALGGARSVYRVAMPYVVALYGVPKILVLPWIALVLGLGAGTAVGTGVLFAVFPVLLMVAAGVRDVDPTLVTVAVSMGASRRQLAAKVLLPAVLPSVLAGMRVAVVFALLGVLLAEMFAGVRGMGYLMQRQAVAFMAAVLFAATAMVSVLSVAVVLFLDHLNQRLGRWR